MKISLNVNYLEVKLKKKQKYSMIFFQNRNKIVKETIIIKIYNVYNIRFLTLIIIIIFFIKQEKIKENR